MKQTTDLTFRDTKIPIKVGDTWHTLRQAFIIYRQDKGSGLANIPIAVDPERVLHVRATCVNIRDNGDRELDFVIAIVQPDGSGGANLTVLPTGSDARDVSVNVLAYE